MFRETFAFVYHMENSISLDFNHHSPKTVTTQGMGTRLTVVRHLNLGLKVRLLTPVIYFLFPPY